MEQRTCCACGGIKNKRPSKEIDKLADKFHKNILEIETLLKPLNLQLLGSGSHPLMNPETDTQLWKHSYSEVYALYNTFLIVRVTAGVMCKALT